MKKSTVKKSAAPVAEFIEFTNESNWVSGSYGDWKFEAKIFDDPSDYGINDGRVSKLEIKDTDGTTVLNYDRGWDIENTKISNDAFVAIMKLLENSPKRFEDKQKDNPGANMELLKKEAAKYLFKHYPAGSVPAVIKALRINFPSLTNGQRWEVIEMLYA